MKITLIVLGVVAVAVVLWWLYGAASKANLDANRH